MFQNRPTTEVLRARLFTGLGVFAGLLTFGTAGYMIIEQWSFFDALFMTVTTVTTVGYREVRPLDTEGRIFTIFLVLFGVGTAFYLLTTFVAFVIEGDLGAALGLTRMKSRIEQLSDHYILCGFGRVGEEIAREFADRGLPFVVVENNPDTTPHAVQSGYLLVEGDATSDEILEQAGVRRAKVLLAASDSDSGNTYITLTAKALNPDIFVVARAGKRESESRAVRAGANRVISPYVLSGRRMALSAIQPNMVDFIETLAIRNADQILAEMEISGSSGLIGLHVGNVLECSERLTVLGLQRANGDLLVGPRPEESLGEGDRLMVVGPEDDVSDIARRIGLRAQSAEHA
ncbi:MAG: NAD-binding protein [Chloroflexi bacterium]|nr:NAD-binding protein [Chloroflexota bacterium]